MIAIVNMGALGLMSASDPDGERYYEVQIRRGGIRTDVEQIAIFTHRRGDGLAVCLRKAAEAVEEARG